MDVAKDIQDVTKERSKTVGSIIRSVSRAMTTTATTAAEPGTGRVWPFFTEDNLDILAEDILAMGSSVELIYAPLVSNKDRDSWELYSVGMQDKVKNTTNYTHQITEYIYGRHLANGTVYTDKNGGPYAPVWQIIPKPSGYYDTSRINYNLLSNERLVSLLQASYISKGAVQSQLVTEGHIFGTGRIASPPGEKRQPQSIQVHPVFESIQHGSSEVVAFLFATVPWDLYLQNIVIPESTATVFCVIQDTCAATAYTYFVKKGFVSYIGEGDLHLFQYGELNRTSILSSYMNPEFRNSGMDEDKCHVTMSIYPSAEMHWSYNNARSFAYLLCLVLFVFILVCIAVATHHRVTEAYQRDTHAKEQRSKAIIASLFPENIREMLFDVEGEVNVDKLSLFNTEVQKTVTKDKDNNDLEKIWGTRDKYADLYQHCTVCICDIVGFSGWASSRDPEEVFILLEAVFTAFDRIAKSRGAYSKSQRLILVCFTDFNVLITSNCIFICYRG